MRPRRRSEPARCPKWDQPDHRDVVVSVPTPAIGSARHRSRRSGKEWRVLAKLSAEFIGTFWLVLGGCGSAVLAAAFPQVGIGLHGVSLAFA